jgi:putative salt-induced outer membrane protein YdiY
MNIKHIALAAAGILATGSTQLFADAATTNSSPAAIKYPWESSISLGLTLTKGNSDTSLFTAKFASGKKTPNNEYSLGADGSYGENDSVKSTEVLHGFTQWNHLFSERMYGYLRADGIHDGIAEIRYRFSVGPGAGYYLLKGKQDTLAVEGGGNIVLQEIGAGTNLQDSVYETLRAAERYEHKFSLYSARFWENAEILPQVDKFQHFLVNAEVGIEAAVAKNLSLQMYVDDAYDSEPASDSKRNDVKLVSGVTYKF